MSSWPTGRHIAFVGMMGAGKTTTAVALAARIGWPVRDCDRDLEGRVGQTAAEFAADEGVGELHRLEAEVLEGALDAEEPTIVTAAGSVVESDHARRMLAKRAFVVWLDVPVDVLVTRMAADTHRRPLDQSAADALLARRRGHLADVADLRLEASAPTRELVDEIVARLGIRL